MFETVIGLEVHLQLATKTKAFCSCSTDFGVKPNLQTCPVCLGLPGSLPVLNEKALEYAVKVALAVGCQVQELIKFDRKNYFYPDLPKNYQISQYDMPIGLDGKLSFKVDGQNKTVQIKRVHLEEDAGKLIHQKEYSLVDYNRAGMPLLEIVTEPDIHSPLEAQEYLKNLKLILQYLDVSDCNMEEGSLRCDANISLRPKGETKLGVKTEVKNMNSFKAVKAALESEVKRQEVMLSKGERIIQETRLWDEDKKATLSMRSKEEAHDYRYFPEPDLTPFTLDDKFKEEIRKTLPELPKERILRYTSKFALSLQEAEILVMDKAMCNLFEASVVLYPEAKKIYNWLVGAILGYSNDKNKGIADLKLKPEELVKLIKYIDEGKLSNLAAKEVLSAMLDESKPADVVIQEKGLVQVSDTKELEEIVKVVIEQNLKSVQDFMSGKENAAMFLVGQAMKLSKGKANPKVVKEIILKILNERKPA